MSRDGPPTSSSDVPHKKGELATTRLARVGADALAAIIESSEDAIYSKDRDALITSWNSAAERLYGYSEEEAVGQPVAMLIPPDRAGEERVILNRILAGERVKHYETQRVCKDGGRVDVSISVSPVHDNDGNIVGAAIIARDVTEEKAMRAALTAARERQAALARKQALDLNDEVVQGLAVAKLALESNDHETGLRAVAATLERAKAIVGRLLDEREQQGPLEPGDLRRGTPSRPLDEA